ncbi:hypothetical protein T11_16762 [Trichinella zimbabwensis]|uniref:Uncharacterized protein n=1 Tax=Trichinella zimbabwensis TaxID=268475 RepID=A0A0V1H3T3_9BILA|nr:hypothetical protein T11_16762 [Trichinella zimbabwensis]
MPPIRHCALIRAASTALTAIHYLTLTIGPIVAIVMKKLSFITFLQNNNTPKEILMIVDDCWSYCGPLPSEQHSVSFICCRAGSYLCSAVHVFAGPAKPLERKVRLVAPSLNERTSCSN